MSEERTDIRDLRDGGFLWIAKTALELVSAKVGNSGIIVYIWLCYYANSKNQDCYPSITTLANRCHVTRRMIMYTLKKLEKLRLISTQREPGKLNTYRLLNVPTSVSHFTSETTDTGVVSLVSPALVKPETHEQELVYQELFNKSTAAFSEERIEELKALCRELFPAINLYQFIQVFKNDRGYPPPVDVMIKLCKRFKKDKHKIKNVWGWFKRTVDAESAQHFAQANIKEHEQLKSEPATVGRIFAQMVNTETKSLGPSDGGGGARVGRGAACQ